MQNTVLSQTFDVLWAEVVVWMRQIVRKHSDLLLEGKRDPNWRWVGGGVYGTKEGFP